MVPSLGAEVGHSLVNGENTRCRIGMITCLSKSNARTKSQVKMVVWGWDTPLWQEINGEDAKGTCRIVSRLDWSRKNHLEIVRKEETWCPAEYPVVDYQPMSSLHRCSNLMWIRGLVKLSAQLSLVWTLMTWTMPFRTWSQKWWYLMNGCLVHGWMASELAIVRQLWLSFKNVQFKVARENTEARKGHVINEAVLRESLEWGCIGVEGHACSCWAHGILLQLCWGRFLFEVYLSMIFSNHSRLVHNQFG